MTREQQLLREVRSRTVTSTGCDDLLAADVVMIGDGGGGVGTGSHVMGAEDAARVLAATVPSFAEIGVVVESSEVNGQPGAILRDGEGRVFSTWTLDIAEGLVQIITVREQPREDHAPAQLHDGQRPARNVARASSGLTSTLPLQQPHRNELQPSELRYVCSPH
jgi:hypothetical protein